MCSSYFHYVQLNHDAKVIMNLQRSQLEDTDMQTKSMSSDKGTAVESTTPNFAMESMEGNISVSSSPEELLEV
jgi:YidC/Oxa1 family membrane protein insertase